MINKELMMTPPINPKWSIKMFKKSVVAVLIVLPMSALLMVTVAMEVWAVTILVAMAMVVTLVMLLVVIRLVVTLRSA